MITTISIKINTYNRKLQGVRQELRKELAIYTSSKESISTKSSRISGIDTFTLLFGRRLASGFSPEVKQPRKSMTRRESEKRNRLKFPPSLSPITARVKRVNSSENTLSSYPNDHLNDLILAAKRTEKLNMFQQNTISAIWTSGTTVFIMMWL